jgi:phage recombination protein Bet
MNARSLAIANENASITASTERAVAAKAAQPVTALQAMASRLQISQANLMNTLKSTAFKGASDSEFAALVVVCNEYRLNPLLKEIYAFPAKGGGIVPMVSVDGWIRIMNDHPQFDGIEFDYIEGKDGKIVAIESIIHRKDRNRPVKVMEYMDECKGNTIPWQKSPRRMLRHRALIQGARIAFGFSGIASEGDEAEFIEGHIVQQPMPISLPSSQSLAAELNDEIPAFDRETGEVFEQDATGMTVVDEETARALDNQDYREGRADEDMGEGFNGTEDVDEKPVWHAKVEELKAGLRAAKNASYVKAIETEYLKNAVALPPEVAEEFEGLLREKRAALKVASDA